MNFKKILLLSLVFITLINTTLFAQQNPSSIKVENLSDQQILQAMGQFQLLGLSDAELEARAREKGFTTDQIVAFKKRVATLDMSQSSSSSAVQSGLSTSGGSSAADYVGRKIGLYSVPRKAIDSSATPIFGANIFDNELLSFEPNLNIATPSNYIIGVNDEIIIDVYGISDITRKIKVNTEGAIRYPKYGPIRIAGLTIEQATSKIKQELSHIYPGLTTGKTSIQLALGQIRSIKITLLGEITRPGNYTVPSLATMMNALYASGGPNNIGDFRNIELVRGGKIVAHFDLYDFLFHGDLSKNVLLQDQDLIKVSPYSKRVSLKGAVKKAAIFDLKENEHASDLIKYAGGFSDIAYKDYVRIIRLGQKEKEVLTIKVSQLGSFDLNSGDTIIVDTLVNRFSNRSIITGSVNYPGAYGINELPSLKEVLLAAKIKENAYVERGVLVRRDEQYKLNMLNFNITDILKGKSNIKLLRDDSIHIYNLDEIKEKYTVKIDGEVNAPGDYEFIENMKVKDLILMANGYKQGASLQKIEIGRRVVNNDANRLTNENQYAIIKDIDLTNNNVDENLEYTLSPFDQVFVRKSFLYKEQILVQIEGEVHYPGKYTLSSNDEKISSLISRAGGLKDKAFLEGAVLLRENKTGDEDVEKTAKSQKAVLLSNQVRQTTINKPLVDTAQKNQVISSIYERQKAIGLELETALKSPGSQQDIKLESGDKLFIPRVAETIQTFGALNIPKQMIYTEGMTVLDAINASGGFNSNAYRRKTYVIYANGKVKKTNKILFIKFYPKLKRGAEVYVPLKPVGNRLTTSEVFSLTGTFVSMAALIFATIKATK